jgi:hypothetical protein
MRTVPSDAWQARTIMELLRHFNWNYIAVVYSAGRHYYHLITLNLRKLWRERFDDITTTFY